MHPDGGSCYPGDNTKLVVHSAKDSPQRLQFRFLPQEGYDNFGYIQHVASGKIVHPSGGSMFPSNDTRLVLHSDHHAGCLFVFDQGNERIVHRNGKFWHPCGGSPLPADNTECVLHSAVHDAAKFYFGDLNGTKISP